MKRLLGLLVLFVLVLSACGGSAAQEPPSSQSAGDGGGESAQFSAERETAADTGIAEEAAAEAPMAESDDSANSVDGQQGEQESSATVAAWDRKIIKNATIRLEAEEVFSIHNRISMLSNQYGGYVVNSRTWYDNEDRPHALYSFAVPVDSFEEALQDVRQQGKVLDEQTSGQDVTDQYVDLEARITNLEATASRIRSFLDDARTVEEALSVNQRLSQVEEQLEQLKGQRNALEQRTSFSTITVEIAPVIPEQATVEETTEWSPAKTFADATEVLMAILQRGADAGIWFGVLGLPVVIVLGVIVLIGRRLLPSRPPVQP